MTGIQSAFFGVICRDSELRTAKSGAPFLQFTVRIVDLARHATRDGAAAVDPGEAA